MVNFFIENWQNLLFINCVFGLSITLMLDDKFENDKLLKNIIKPSSKSHFLKNASFLVLSSMFIPLFAIIVVIATIIKKMWQ